MSASLHIVSPTSHGIDWFHALTHDTVPEDFSTAQWAALRDLFADPVTARDAIAGLWHLRAGAPLHFSGSSLARRTAFHLLSPCLGIWLRWFPLDTCRAQYPFLSRRFPRKALLVLWTDAHVMPFPASRRQLRQDAPASRTAEDLDAFLDLVPDNATSALLGRIAGQVLGSPLDGVFDHLVYQGADWAEIRHEVAIRGLAAPRHQDEAWTRRSDLLVRVLLAKHIWDRSGNYQQSGVKPLSSDMGI